MATTPPSIKVAVTIDHERMEYLSKKALADLLVNVRNDIDAMLREVRREENRLRKIAEGDDA